MLSIGKTENWKGIGKFAADIVFAALAVRVALQNLGENEEQES